MIKQYQKSSLYIIKGNISFNINSTKNVERNLEIYFTERHHLAVL